MRLTRRPQRRWGCSRCWAGGVAAADRGVSV
jgi:hypothetical protein